MPPLPSPSESAGPVHQRRKAERPQELLDAALALFVERGFAATRIDDVAQRAGVSKGTLYLYYPSKVELLKAVLQHFLTDEIARGAAAADAFDGTTPDLMREVCAAWWLRIINSPASGVFKVMITEMRNFPEIASFYRDEVILPGHRVLHGMLARGVERGEFKPIDLHVAVQSVLLPMVMFCLHKHSFGACMSNDMQDSPEHFVHGHLSLLLHGLLVTPSATAASPVCPAVPPS